MGRRTVRTRRNPCSFLGSMIRPAQTRFHARELAPSRFQPKSAPPYVFIPARRARSDRAPSPSDSARSPTSWVLRESGVGSTSSDRPRGLKVNARGRPAGLEPRPIWCRTSDPRHRRAREGYSLSRSAVRQAPPSRLVRPDALPAYARRLRGRRGGRGTECRSRRPP